MGAEPAKCFLCFQETRRCPAQGHVHVAIVGYAPQGVSPPRQQDQLQQPRQKLNRGSAVQLRVKSHVQLKPGRILS